MNSINLASTHHVLVLHCCLHNPHVNDLQVLAEKLAEGLPIKHGSVIERVDWGSEGVTVHCKGGEQCQADAVIVTVSLGVLKVQPCLK